jgi:hypothetical protein
MSKIIKHIFDVYKKDINIKNKNYIWDNLFNSVPKYLKVDLYKLMLEHNVGSLNYASNNYEIIKLYILHYIKSNDLKYYNGIENDIYDLVKLYTINDEPSLINNRVNLILELYSQNIELDSIKKNYLENNISELYLMELSFYTNDLETLNDIEVYENIYEVSYENTYSEWETVAKDEYKNYILPLFIHYLKNVYFKLQSCHSENEGRCLYMVDDDNHDEEKIILQRKYIIEYFLNNKSLIKCLLKYKNKNMLWEIVKSNPDIVWDYDYLSNHPCITQQVIFENLDLFKSYENNPNIKKIINLENDYIKLVNYFNGISKDLETEHNSNLETEHNNDYLLDVDYVLKLENINSYLSWVNIATNKNINLSLFRYYLENVYSNLVLYKKSHTNKCLCIIHKRTDEEILKDQKNIIIKKFLNNETIINSLLIQSKYKNLLWEIIKFNSHVSWDYHYLSSHPCITWQEIIENPELNWSYRELCNNINMTLDNIKLFIKFNNVEINNFNKPRDLFAKNINLTSEEIDTILNEESKLLYKKYYNLKNDPLALNPNITYNIIKKYGSVDIIDNYNTLIKNQFLENTLLNKEYYKIIQTHKQNFKIKN